LGLEASNAVAEGRSVKVGVNAFIIARDTESRARVRRRNEKRRQSRCCRWWRKIDSGNSSFPLRLSIFSIAAA
jgi:hypothetical protein